MYFSSKAPPIVILYLQTIVLSSPFAKQSGCSWQNFTLLTEYLFFTLFFPLRLPLFLWHSLDLTAHRFPHTNTRVLTRLTLWITSAHLSEIEKMACRWEAAVRHLGVRIKRVWNRDINWKWEICLACHKSISTLAVDMFSLFLVFLWDKQQVAATLNPIQSGGIHVFHISFYPITTTCVGSGGRGVGTKSALSLHWIITRIMWFEWLPGETNESPPKSALAQMLTIKAAWVYISDRHYSFNSVCKAASCDM